MFPKYIILHCEVELKSFIPTESSLQLLHDSDKRKGYDSKKSIYSSVWMYAFDVI